MKYSSLFTHPSQSPINRAFGEVKSRLHSSPLFTTLHPSLSCYRKGGFWQIQLPSPLFLLSFFLDVHLWVKRGEEWWRVAGTLHLVKRPVYRGLRGMGEEWRVLSSLSWLMTQLFFCVLKWRKLFFSLAFPILFTNFVASFPRWLAKGCWLRSLGIGYIF